MCCTSLISSMSTHIHTADLKRPEYLRIMLGTAVITQQISIITIFLVVFLQVSRDALSVQFLFAIDIFLLAVGFLFSSPCSTTFSRTHSSKEGIFSTLWWFFLLAASLRVLSPVLRTSTVSYSDDTIYALTLLLLGIHLLFYDYSSSSASLSLILEDKGTRIRGEHKGSKLGSTVPPCKGAGAAAASASTANPTMPLHQLHGTVSLNASMFAVVLLASR